MRYAFLLLLLAGCASADVSKMSALDLCYTRAVDDDLRSKAEAEIAKRRLDCTPYAAEIKKMNEQEQRAGTTGGGIGDATPKQGGMTKGGY
jgi:hypothetical protein